MLRRGNTSTAVALSSHLIATAAVADRTASTLSATVVAGGPVGVGVRGFTTATTAATTTAFASPTRILRAPSNSNNKNRSSSSSSRNNRNNSTSRRSNSGGDRSANRSNNNRSNKYRGGGGSNKKSSTSSSSSSNYNDNNKQQPISSSSTRTSESVIQNASGASKNILTTIAAAAAAATTTATTETTATATVASSGPLHPPPRNKNTAGNKETTTTASNQPPANNKPTTTTTTSSGTSTPSSNSSSNSHGRGGHNNNNNNNKGGGSHRHHHQHHNQKEKRNATTSTSSASGLGGGSSASSASSSPPAAALPAVLKRLHKTWCVDSVIMAIAPSNTTISNSSGCTSGASSVLNKQQQQQQQQGQAAEWTDLDDAGVSYADPVIAAAKASHATAVVSALLITFPTATTSAATNTASSSSSGSSGSHHRRDGQRCLTILRAVTSLGLASFSAAAADISAAAIRQQHRNIEERAGQSNALHVSTSNQEANTTNPVTDKDKDDGTAPDATSTTTTAADGGHPTPDVPQTPPTPPPSSSSSPSSAAASPQPPSVADLVAAGLIPRADGDGEATVKKEEGEGDTVPHPPSLSSSSSSRLHQQSDVWARQTLQGALQWVAENAHKLSSDDAACAYHDVLALQADKALHARAQARTPDEEEGDGEGGDEGGEVKGMAAADQNSSISSRNSRAKNNKKENDENEEENLTTNDRRHKKATRLPEQNDQLKQQHQRTHNPHLLLQVDASAIALAANQLLLAFEHASSVSPLNRLAVLYRTSDLRLPLSKRHSTLLLQSLEDSTLVSAIVTAQQQFRKLSAEGAITTDTHSNTPTPTSSTGSVFPPPADAALPVLCALMLAYLDQYDLPDVSGTESARRHIAQIYDLCRSPRCVGVTFLPHPRDILTVVKVAARSRNGFLRPHLISGPVVAHLVHAAPAAGQFCLSLLLDALSQLQLHQTQTTLSSPPPPPPPQKMEEENEGGKLSNTASSNKNMNETSSTPSLVVCRRHRHADEEALVRVVLDTIGDGADLWEPFVTAAYARLVTHATMTMTMNTASVEGAGAGGSSSSTPTKTTDTMMMTSLSSVESHAYNYEHPIIHRIVDTVLRPTTRHGELRAEEEEGKGGEGIAAAAATVPTTSNSTEAAATAAVTATPEAHHQPLASTQPPLSSLFGGLNPTVLVGLLEYHADFEVLLRVLGPAAVGTLLQRPQVTSASFVVMAELLAVLVRARFTRGIRIGGPDETTPDDRKSVMDEKTTTDTSDLLDTLILRTVRRIESSIVSKPGTLSVVDYPSFVVPLALVSDILRSAEVLYNDRQLSQKEGGESSSSSSSSTTTSSSTTMTTTIADSSSCSNGSGGSGAGRFFFADHHSGRHTLPRVCVGCPPSDLQDYLRALGRIGEAFAAEFIRRCQKLTVPASRTLAILRLPLAAPTREMIATMFIGSLQKSISATCAIREALSSIADTDATTVARIVSSLSRITLTETQALYLFRRPEEGRSILREIHRFARAHARFSGDAQIESVLVNRYARYYFDALYLQIARWRFANLQLQQQHQQPGQDTPETTTSTSATTSTSSLVVTDVFEPKVDPEAVKHVFPLPLGFCPYTTTSAATNTSSAAGEASTSATIMVPPSQQHFPTVEPWHIEEVLAVCLQARALVPDIAAPTIRDCVRRCLDHIDWTPLPPTSAAAVTPADATTNVNAKAATDATDAQDMSAEALDGGVLRYTGLDDALRTFPSPSDIPRRLTSHFVVALKMGVLNYTDLSPRAVTAMIRGTLPAGLPLLMVAIEGAKGDPTPVLVHILDAPPAICALTLRVWGTTAAQRGGFTYNSSGTSSSSSLVAAATVAASMDPATVRVLERISLRLDRDGAVAVLRAPASVAALPPVVVANLWAAADGDLLKAAKDGTVLQPEALMSIAVKVPALAPELAAALRARAVSFVSLLMQVDRPVPMIFIDAALDECTLSPASTNVNDMKNESSSSSLDAAAAGRLDTFTNVLKLLRYITKHFVAAPTTNSGNTATATAGAASSRHNNNSNSNNHRGSGGGTASGVSGGGGEGPVISVEAQHRLRSLLEKAVVCQHAATAEIDYLLAVSGRLYQQLSARTAAAATAAKTVAAESSALRRTADCDPDALATLERTGTDLAAEMAAMQQTLETIEGLAVRYIPFAVESPAALEKTLACTPTPLRPVIMAVKLNAMLKDRLDAATVHDCAEVIATAQLLQKHSVLTPTLQDAVSAYVQRALAAAADPHRIQENPVTAAAAPLTAANNKNGAEGDEEGEGNDVNNSSNEDTEGGEAENATTTTVTSNSNTNSSETLSSSSPMPAEGGEAAVNGPKAPVDVALALLKVTLRGADIHNRAVKPIVTALIDVAPRTGLRADFLLRLLQAFVEAPAVFPQHRLVVDAILAGDDAESMTAAEFSRLTSSMSRMKSLSANREAIADLLASILPAADAHSQATIFKAVSNDKELLQSTTELVLEVVSDSVPLMGGDDLDAVATAMIQAAGCGAIEVEAMDDLLEGVSSRILAIAEGAKRSSLVRFLQLLTHFRMQDEAVLEALYNGLDHGKMPRLDTNQLLTILRSMVELDVPPRDALILQVVKRLEPFVEAMPAGTVAQTLGLLVDLNVAYLPLTNALFMRASDAKDGMRQSGAAAQALMEKASEEYTIEAPPHVTRHFLKKKKERARLEVLRVMNNARRQRRHAELVAAGGSSEASNSLFSTQ